MTGVAVREQMGQVTSSDEWRWDAMMRRDARADGAFYYSVRTTGVYCRPTCPSRRPLRANVRFHTTREEAERAGFRPCKRCRPQDEGLAARHTAAVARACRLIEEAEEVPSLQALSDAVGLSRFHFHRLFKASTGVTPKAYAAAHRANRVRDALGAAETVTDAFYDAGFNSSGRFYSSSASMLGMAPTAFRSGGEGTTIRFAVGDCSLGSILVAATEKGVCAISLGDDPEPLVRELQDRFPNAHLSGGDADFDALVAKVVGFVEAPDAGLGLPLDVRGTAFQQRVWQALQKVPAGKTVSYAELGRRIGHPQGARAVAQACGANPIAIAIPCHRVVRTDGAVSGYRWGVERKRTLLARERTSRVG